MEAAKAEEMALEERAAEVKVAVRVEARVAVAREAVETVA